jgi:DNA-binding MarR family transcriptional regulator
MKPRVARELEILTAIEESTALTQRALAARLGVALGLTNLYVKRLVRKGYVKTVGFPSRPAARKRLRYLLTPRGIAEKSRLTYEHIGYSLTLYRRTRETLRDALGQLPANGMKRIALYGTGEAAELAYLTLREFGLEPIGVFSADGGGQFLGFPVRPVAELAGEDVDRIVLATFDKPEPVLAALEHCGLARDRFLTLRRLPVGASAPSRRPQ